MRDVSGANEFLRGRILTRATAIAGDEARALEWFEHAAIAGFGGRTAAQMVEAGHAEAVWWSLEGMDHGVQA